ncbi:hypothetical protein HanHA89_Chr04g0171641 [Helianthus annuus]|nr:hypothetical protein HanHA89_Chr04g0171641 [Helianthus annuus]
MLNMMAMVLLIMTLQNAPVGLDYERDKKFQRCSYLSFTESSKSCDGFKGDSKGVCGSMEHGVWEIELYFLYSS